MTDQPDGGDNNDDPPKPPTRPDPFAPLPLADLPPVRRRGPPDPNEPAATRPRARPSDRPAPPDTRPPPTAPNAPAAPLPPDSQASGPQAASSTNDPRGAMSSTDQQSPPGPSLTAPDSQPAGSQPAGSPTDPRGSLSWTDMPAPGSQSPGLAPSDQSSDTSGAMAWTDMPGPPMSGAPDTQGPDPTTDPPLLPTTFDENDLRSAVGATQLPVATPSSARKSRRAPTDDDDPDDGAGDASRPRSRKMMLIGALTLVVGGGIAAMVIVGKINSQRYLITCEADRVVVEQGRSFPPWGESTLAGAEWKALKIPPEAPCAPYETENRGELAARYLDILKDHATTLLTAREVTKIDDAEAQLKQALLVARSLATDDERINAREEIERLLGDVVYWRASAKLRSASEALTEAANQFDMAAKQRPRHVTDAAAWSLYVRKLVDQLRAGPAGVAPATFPPLPPGERPTAPTGVALPVEPGTDSGSGSAVEPMPAPPADAGLPTGGVLL